MSTSFKAEKFLAESKHYKIVSEYETVELIFKDSDRKIRIGDFYGDPEGAFIDVNEKFCVMYGCGIIIYFIREPFEEYRYCIDTEQWNEYGRDPKNILWVEDAKQIDENNFKAVIEDGKIQNINITFE